jgi:TolB-like protein
MASGPLSLIVLPFVNLSAVQHCDFIVDAVTERLTGELERIADSFVVARERALAYRGTTLYLPEIGAERGVRFAVRGSLRACRDGLRVYVQLAETADDLALWTDRFDLPAVEPSAMPDAIVERIFPALYASLLVVTGRVFAPLPATPSPARTVPLVAPPELILILSPQRAATPRAARAPPSPRWLASLRAPWSTGIQALFVGTVGLAALLVLGVNGQSVVAVASFMLIAAGGTQLFGNLVRSLS